MRAWKHRATAPQLTQHIWKLSFHLHTPKYLLIAQPPVYASLLQLIISINNLKGSCENHNEFFILYNIMYNTTVLWQTFACYVFLSLIIDLSSKYLLHMKASLLTYFYKHFYILLFFLQVQMIFQNPFPHFQVQINTLRQISKYL